MRAYLTFSVRSQTSICKEHIMVQFLRIAQFFDARRLLGDNIGCAFSAVKIWFIKIFVVSVGMLTLDYYCAFPRSSLAGMKFRRPNEFCITSAVRSRRESLN